MTNGTRPQIHLDLLADVPAHFFISIRNFVLYIDMTVTIKVSKS